MLSQATRRELQAEQDRLRKRLNAIEQILAEEAGFLRQRDTESATGNGDFAEFGLREAVRNVLQADPRGLKPMGVAQRMQELGFRGSTKATTSLLTRVRNELWRMAKKGELHSVRGVYSLPREQG